MRVQVVIPGSDKKGWIELAGPRLIVEGGGRQVTVSEHGDEPLQVETRAIEVPHGPFSTIDIPKLRELVMENARSSAQFQPGALLSFSSLCPHKSSQLALDLGAIEFAHENLITESELPEEALVGYHRLPNGLSFLGCLAGAEHETMLFFAVYFDGEKLRAYFPQDGNPYNTDFKAAYGRHGRADLVNAVKRFAHTLHGLPERKIDLSVDLEPEVEAIRADLLARFK
ncbi:MAG: hypothetical protein K1X83_02380 [Oligoflexia bacterium]|nr:hypothetical protein [Oligoflexia bacterium]